jgi:threonyl-tRNA synthetase
MSKIKMTLKDGAVREVEQGTTLAEAAKTISRNLEKAALVAKIDGHLTDLNTKLEKDAAVEFLTFEDENGRLHYGIPAHIF